MPEHEHFCFVFCHVVAVAAVRIGGVKISD